MVCLCVQNYYEKDLRFQMFDHGTNCSLSEPFKETCNQMKYGSLRPLEYDLSKITANVVSHAVIAKRPDGEVCFQLLEGMAIALGRGTCLPTLTCVPPVYSQLAPKDMLGSVRIPQECTQH